MKKIFNSTGQRISLGCRGCEFVKAPWYTYIFCLSVYLWWAFSNYLFFLVILFPRVKLNLMRFSEYPLFSLLCGCFCFCSTMCLISLIRATFSSPGILEDGYEEVLTNQKDRSVCSKCNKVRPRRTHHCRVCGVCIRQFDHHCRWINNCVGEDNKWLFVLLIFYSTCLSGCMFAVCCFYFYVPVYSAMPHAEQDLNQSFFIRHEFYVMICETIVTAWFGVNLAGQFLSRVLFVRTGTTSFQSVVDPMFNKTLPPSESIVAAFSKTFGTENKLLWLFGPLRRYKPKVQLIYDYRGKEPNVL